MSVEEAIHLARRYHEGAVDKAGRPYIEHPLRVMARVTSDDAKLAAVLHDLLEDTTLTARDLAAAGCPTHVVQAVEALTRRPDEAYDDFVRRAAADRLARAVKAADIADNLDPDRLAALPEDDAARLRAKYANALAIIEGTALSEPAPTHAELFEAPGSVAGPVAGWDCGACGHPAGRVELRRAGGDRASLTVTSLMGSSLCFVPPEAEAHYADAVANRDANALARLEAAPFWCPQCQQAYCYRHWLTEEVMDEGFYDCTYGTCPHDHRVMIDD